MATDAPPAANASPHFVVTGYVVNDHGLLPTNVWASILSKYTGPGVSIQDIVKGASELQAEYRDRGYPGTSIAIAQEQITNGIVTLNVFQTAIPQIIVSGVRYYSPTNNTGLAAYSPPVQAAQHPAPELAATNAAPLPPPIIYPAKRATPQQLAADRQRLLQEMARFDAEQRDHRIHVVSTNAGPRFDVEHYIISGNSVLAPQMLAATLTNIDGAFGTNVSFEGVKAAVEQLEQAYHERGYETVTVDVPRQTLTNATVKLEVLEGRLAHIDVVGNRYFSSNNVMASLPSLHTNMVLDVPVFNAELNRANANQDRQIYPLVGPGPTPGTSDLTLKVKDRLPLHGKFELNNQSSPGTPDLRLNASAVYDNLWQAENSLGVQYSFSPESYKVGPQWPFYDRPSVVDYSAFYRLPLGNPESLENQIYAKPGSFGYNEATRQFNVPPPSAQPDLTVYASRATIDTGLQTLQNNVLLDIPDVRELSQQEVQEGITINEDVGFQLSKPLPPADGFQSTITAGLDYKVYQAENFQTNIFRDDEFFASPGGTFTERTSYDYLQTPTTQPRVDYLPIQLTFAGNVNNILGPASFGLRLSVNPWFSSTTTYSSASTNPPANLSGVKSLQSITGSSESSGYWVILRPSFSQQFDLYTNWTTSVRLDGQWASQPLISTEQFGAGGVNSVRGYNEGEVFGDDGWLFALDQQTAPLVVGDLYHGVPLVVRASVYMDYADVYLIDPQGRPPVTSLWGAGFGFSASAGPHWQAQFLFSWPLLSAGTIQAYHPFFNFALTGQF